MWQTPYDGSDSEIAVVAAVLRGESYETVCRETSYKPADVVAIVTDYLRERQKLLVATDPRLISQAFRLATMDACLERMHPLAIAAAESADVKIVRAYFAMISERARLEEQLYQWNLARGNSTSDASKAQTPGQDARSRHLRLMDYAERGLLDAEDMDFEEATEAIVNSGG